VRKEDGLRERGGKNKKKESGLSYISLLNQVEKPNRGGTDVMATSKGPKKHLPKQGSEEKGQEVYLIPRQNWSLQKEKDTLTRARFWEKRNNGRDDDKGESRGRKVTTTGRGG